MKIVVHRMESLPDPEQLIYHFYRTVGLFYQGVEEHIYPTLEIILLPDFGHRLQDKRRRQLSELPDYEGSEVKDLELTIRRQARIFHPGIQLSSCSDMYLNLR